MSPGGVTTFSYIHISETVNKVNKAQLSDSGPFCLSCLLSFFLYILA